MCIRSSTLACVVISVAGCAQPSPPSSSADSSGAERSSGDDVVTTVTVERDPEPISEPTAAAPPPAPAEQVLVLVNGVQLASPDLAELHAIFGVGPASGRYWYDAMSGLWGLEGHGAGGVTRPSLRTAAALAPEASAGTSGAFVNGRQLPQVEFTVMATLLGWPLPADSRYSGHYTLDGEGALNSAKGRYLGNVAAAAKREAAGEPPGAIRCIWYHLHEPDESFGRDVTIACD